MSGAEIAEGLADALDRARRSGYLDDRSSEGHFDFRLPQEEYDRIPHEETVDSADEGEPPLRSKVLYRDNDFFSVYAYPVRVDDETREGLADATPRVRSA